MTMTSQKRYRHHHDNNAAARFRDLPPRFKRQKSSSSPKPTQENSDLGNQENERCMSPVPSSFSPAIIQSDSINCTCSSASSDEPMKHPFRTLTSQQARLGAWPGQVTRDPLLSVNTGALDYNLTPGREAYSGGEYLMHQNYFSPPLSPWAVLDNRECAASDIFRPEVSAYSPSLRSSPGLGSGSEQLAPALEMARTTGCERWAGPTDSPHQDRLTTGSPAQTQPGHQSSTTQEVVDKPAVDYSDPDIRTIEMLRELERVADQKEKEDESDMGVDRKNLVSHHLRMLMCAVDRYTADLGDNPADSDVARQDPTPPPVDAARPSVTPSPSQSPPAPEMTCDWQVKQSRKPRAVTSKPSQTKQDKFQERKSLNAQGIRGSQNWSTCDQSRLPTQQRNNQWSSVPQQQQLYTGAWQTSRPVQSQSPPSMPIKVTTPPPPARCVPSPVNRISTPQSSPAPRAITAANPIQTDMTSPPPAMTGFTSPPPSTMFSSHILAPPPHVVTSQSLSPPPAATRQVPSPPMQQNMSSGQKDLLMPEAALAHIWGLPSPALTPCQEKELKTWDIWSSPSFVNIYSQEPYDKNFSCGANAQNDYLIYLNATDPKARKPLYNR